MAKAVVAYHGYNSVGARIVLAQRADSVWFLRTAVNHPVYGHSMSAWRQYNDEVAHPTKLRCEVEAGGTDTYQYLSEEDSKKYVSWGFTTLDLMTGELTFRLPNIKE